MEALIHSIQVGKTREFPCESDSTSKRLQTTKPWSSAIIKEPVSGPVRVSTHGLDGDQQSDRESHGGVDKAVLCYGLEHYRKWNEIYPLCGFNPGGFGENLTLSGLTEREVCVGDQWEASGVVFEISQPRQPCWKLARRWGIKELVRQVTELTNPGWYCRVIKPGAVSAGSTVSLIARPFPTWSVHRLLEMLFQGRLSEEDRVDLEELLPLSEAYRSDLLRG